MELGTCSEVSHEPAGNAWCARARRVENLVITSRAAPLVLFHDRYRTVYPEPFALTLVRPLFLQSHFGGLSSVQMENTDLQTLSNLFATTFSADPNQLSSRSGA
jgi:hypothetical protein